MKQVVSPGDIKDTMKLFLFFPFSQYINAVNVHLSIQTAVIALRYMKERMDSYFQVIPT